MSNTKDYKFEKQVELLIRDNQTGKMAKNVTYGNDDIASIAFVIDQRYQVLDVITISLTDEQYKGRALACFESQIKVMVKHQMYLHKVVHMVPTCLLCGSPIFTVQDDGVLFQYCLNIDCSDQRTLNRLSHQLYTLSGLTMDAFFADMVKQFQIGYSRLPTGVLDLLIFILNSPIQKIGSEHNSVLETLRNSVKSMDTVKFFELCGLPDGINHEDITMTGVPLDYIVANCVQLILQSDFNHESVRSILVNMVVQPHVLEYMVTGITANRESMITLNNIKIL